MTARDVGIIVPLWALLALPHFAIAESAMSRVTVRVYDTAGLSPELTTAALVVAGRTIASAAADVTWKHCDARTPGHDCGRPPAGEFVVRVVRSIAEPHEKHLPLGDAFVDTRSGAAVLATIYFDRVARVAQAARMRTAKLLGYAVAHELGHLLLASSAHNTRGLMRPVWRDDELRNQRATDWEFTNVEVAAIRARLGSPVRPMARSRVLSAGPAGPSTPA